MIYLVRHGQVHNPDNVMYGLLPGWSLSAHGEFEVAEAAEWLAGKGIDAVFSSPLERAVSTAEAIAASAGAEVVTRDDLIEWELGKIWGGMRWDDIPVERPDEWDQYMDSPAEATFLAESLDDLAARMARAISEISEQFDSAAVVSHSDPLKAATLALTGGSLSELHRITHPTGGVVSLDMSSSPATIAEKWSPGGARTGT